MVAGVGFGSAVFRARVVERRDERATTVGSTATSAPTFERNLANLLATHHQNLAHAQAKRVIGAANQVRWGF